jgi:hypothetical protein
LADFFLCALACLGDMREGLEKRSDVFRSEKPRAGVEKVFCDGKNYS